MVPLSLPSLPTAAQLRNACGDEGRLYTCEMGEALGSLRVAWGSVGEGTSPETLGSLTEPLACREIYWDSDSHQSIIASVAHVKVLSVNLNSAPFTIQHVADGTTRLNNTYFQVAKTQCQNILT